MVGESDLNSTQMLSVDPMKTQMGAVTTCPVCKTTVPALEKYCSDCGYLLEGGEPAGLDLAVTTERAIPAKLTDTTDGRTYPLREGVNTVGRQGADIITAEGTVSRLHAQITVANGRITVEDLGSSNGTRVDNARIETNTPVELSNGANIRFGNWKLNLTILEQKVSTDPTIAIAAPLVEQGDTDVHDSSSPDVTAEPQADPVAVLRWMDGPGIDILIPAGNVTLGRRPENTVVLTGDQYVSGRHASISASENRVILTDDGSRNGTFVNGERQQEHQPIELATGDTVKIGQTTYQLAFVPTSKSTQENASPYE